MAGVTETNRRRARVARLLVAFQSSRGTIADDFTVADAAVLWTRSFKVPVARRKSAPGPWMTEPLGEAEASRFSLPENPGGVFRLNATPESIKLLLRSNFGAFAAGSFTLRSQIKDAEHLTLAWVEDHRAGAVQRLVRVPDVFIHKVRFIIDRTTGIVELEVEWQGRGPRIFDDLDALPVDVKLPASPMKPSFKKFRARGGELTRDPAGLDVDLRYELLTIELDQGLISEWTMTEKWDVGKRGKTKATIMVVTNWSDETWGVADDSRSETKRTYRVRLVSDGPAPETLTFTFQEISFENVEAGKEGFDYEDFEDLGQAHVGSGGFIDIALA